MVWSKEWPSSPHPGADWLQQLGPSGRKVITEHGWYYPRSDEPAFHHFHVRYADASAPPPSVSSAGGTSIEPDVAVLKGVSEAVERYCAGSYDRSAITYASFRELAAEAIDPRRFVLFHPSQYGAPGFPLRPVRPDSRIGWVRGFSATEQREVFVPAAVVHSPYDAHTPDECFELAPVSGYSCGQSLEQAVLHGLCEVVERDAFMVAWYTRRRPVAIDLRTAPPAVQERLARYRDCRVELSCLDVTTDVGIPAIIALMKSEMPGMPAIVVASAANLSAEVAVVRALEELASNLILVRGLLEMRSPNVRLPAPHEVETPEDHGLLYADPRAIPRLDSLLRPSRLAPFETLPAPPNANNAPVALAECVSRLAARGLDAVFVELTKPEVAELGFRVVKVLVPGMQPIDFGSRFRHLGGPRLAQVPERLGYPCGSLNLEPHPFP